MEDYLKVVRGEPALLPLVDRALFKLSGPDRVRYLNGQITNDVYKLLPGRSLYGALLTGKGKIVSDLFVSADNDALWIDTPLCLRSIAEQRLVKFLIADDASLEDLTENYSLAHLFIAQEQPHTDCFLPRTSPAVFRNPRFGPPGCDVWTPKNQPPPFVELPVVDPVVADTFRIEFALGKWGAELDDNTLPQEALFERHGLSYDKGCYVGQETVARIRSIGHVNRQLAFLELAEGPVPLVPSPLQVETTEAGKLTSLAYSPALQKTVGLGLISRKFNHTGQVLQSGGSRFIIANPPETLP